MRRRWAGRLRGAGVGALVLGETAGLGAVGGALCLAIAGQAVLWGPVEGLGLGHLD